VILNALKLWLPCSAGESLFIILFILFNYYFMRYSYLCLSRDARPKVEIEWRIIPTLRNDATATDSTQYQPPSPEHNYRIRGVNGVRPGWPYYHRSRQASSKHAIAEAPSRRCIPLLSPEMSLSLYVRDREHRWCKEEYGRRTYICSIDSLERSADLSPDRD
jgi:hypothetical protein